MAKRTFVAGMTCKIGNLGKTRKQRVHVAAHRSRSFQRLIRQAKARRGGRVERHAFTALMGENHRR